MQTFFSDAMTKYDPLQMCDNSKKEKKKRERKQNNTGEHWLIFFRKQLKQSKYQVHV